MFLLLHVQVRAVPRRGLPVWATVVVVVVVGALGASEALCALCGLSVGIGVNWRRETDWPHLHCSCLLVESNLQHCSCQGCAALARKHTVVVAFDQHGDTTASRFVHSVPTTSAACLCGSARLTSNFKREK
jgi:hypothetical protein